MDRFFLKKLDRPGHHRLAIPYQINCLTTNIKKIKATINDAIEDAPYLTVISDGWSNKRSESIINYVIATPTPLFYKSTETGANRHTADYIANGIDEVIVEISGDSEKVWAILTDNANNMKAAGRILKSKYPNINIIGCAAHGLNLLFGDIIGLPTFNDIYKKSKDIVKYFKRTQVVSAVFHAKQKSKFGSHATSLKLASATRWNSNLHMFSSLLSGKESLRETVIQEDLGIIERIRSLVLNDTFWNKLADIVNLLKPIAKNTTKIEGDEAVISDVPQTLRDIYSELDVLLPYSSIPINERPKVLDFVMKRKQMICQNVHYAANLLDPRYRGANLLPDELNEALDYISELANAKFDTAVILGNLAEYRAREGIWSKSSIWDSSNHVHPRTWWKGLLKEQPLHELAVPLFSIPPSSAAAERIWSAFGNTHTSLRNRLSNDRVEKLVTIRSNLVLKVNKDKKLTVMNQNDSDDTDYSDSE